MSSPCVEQELKWAQIKWELPRKIYLTNKALFSPSTKVFLLLLNSNCFVFCNKLICMQQNFQMKWKSWIHRSKPSLNAPLEPNLSNKFGKARNLAKILKKNKQWIVFLIKISQSLQNYKNTAGVWLHFMSSFSQV